MKKQAKSRILTSLMTLLLAFSLIVSIPNFNPTVAAATATTVAATSSETTLADNVQDGVILHAWNWSYNTIKSHLDDIKAAGYTTIQTSPVQQPKDYNASYADVNGQWWKLYQPVSFSIAQQSWIGTKDELASLCSAAHDKGMKIICDIVANHLGNDGNSNAALDSEVGTYESEIYNNYNTYIHSYRDCSDDSIPGVVQGNIGMPDVNTGNSYIQGRVINLLKQCIDCGVDGFRFDAAKHIETSNDQDWSSNFWNNVISTATSYAKEKKNISLYCYGEILNTPGNGRSWSSYTSLMSITDNKTGNSVLENVKNHNASGASSSYYNTQQSASKLVLWAESHDTYTGGESKDSQTSDLNKAWAIVASRAKASSLYFARPGAKMGECGTMNYKDSEVAAVNNFHNAFIGAEEWLSSKGNVVMNERYFTKGATDGGAVLVNVNGTNTSVDMAVNCLGDGSYEDVLTGNTFTVQDGQITGNIGSTGVAVLYSKADPKPANTISQAGGSFTSETLDITVGLSNAKSGTYKIGKDGEEVSYINSTTFTIGEDMEAGDSVTIYLTASDGKETTEAHYTFTKKEKADTVNVYFTNNYGWDQVYAYYWGGENPSDEWPGNKMTYVSTNEYDQKVYTIEVPADVTGLIFNNGGSEQTANITTGIKDNAGFYISGGSSSAYTVGTYEYSGSTVDPVEEITVYFTNNYNWSNVYCYYWGGSSDSVSWPGTQMTYVEKNDYNQSVYSITIPSDVTGIIFNSGNGEQTADITSGITDGTGYYISGGSSDAYTVGTYTH